MQSALTFSPFHLPAPAIFPFPFPLPFSHFVAFSTRVELPPGKEVSNDLTEHSRFRSPNSNVGLYRRCLPVAYPFFLWRSDAVFLPSRTKKNSSPHRGTWQHDSGFKRLTRFRSHRISNYAKWNCSFQWQQDVNGVACRTGVIVFTLSDLTRQVGTVVASHADILSTRHALLLNDLVRQ